MQKHIKSREEARETIAKKVDVPALEQRIAVLEKQVAELMSKKKESK